MSQSQPPKKDLIRPAATTRPTASPGRTTGSNQPTTKESFRPAQPARPVAPPQVSWTDPSQRLPLLVLGGLVVLLIVAYWDMFALTSAAWSEGLYSHGWLVPVIALGLLWLRWEPFGPVPNYERWGGLLLLAAGLGARLFAAEYGMNPVDRLSFIVSIFGVFMLVGGMQIIRWAGPALAFLVFMFPLPTIFEVNILLRLQRLASICSTFVLQTMGVAAFRQGNLITMPGLGEPLNVAEACSGLRMATIFGAFAVAMVFLIERPWWDKFVILLSAIPIALLVNVIRITSTALLMMWLGPESEFVRKFAHDWPGWLMMPLALGFLFLELQILERVTVPVDTVQLRPVGGAGRGVATIPVR
jgi:exosortase